MKRGFRLTDSRFCFPTCLNVTGIPNGLERAALKNFSREIRATIYLGRTKEEKGEAKEKMEQVAKLVCGQRKEKVKRQREKKMSGTREAIYRLYGSPSQITSVYALKCEMVQTAQLP